MTQPARNENPSAPRPYALSPQGEETRRHHHDGAQHDGRPLVFMGYVCLDTHAYAGGALSALDVAADVLYQADQAGTYRGEFKLEEFQRY